MPSLSEALDVLEEVLGHTCYVEGEPGMLDS